MLSEIILTTFLAIFSFHLFTLLLEILNRLAADFFYSAYTIILIMSLAFHSKHSKNPISSVLLLLLLAALCSSYTLEGQWQLTPKQLIYTQSNPNVAFQFVNNIVTPSIVTPRDSLDGESTTTYNPTNQILTIYACKTLTYNYWINENSIYFYPIQNSSLNRPCQTN